MYVTTFIRFAQNSSVGSMLALYGFVMHVATLKDPRRLTPLYEDISGQHFFLLSVLLAKKISKMYPGLQTTLVGKII